MTKTVLVTGGTGFVGAHIIFQLLQRGYNVKTIHRSLSSKSKVIDTLRSNGINTFESLAFVEADLSKDDNWVIRPAVEGIVRVLKLLKMQV
ncbi:GDP-mannose 4,6-dehydratase [Clostridium chromiireducens]|uniref:GDP-mannose 4,6-dehydratase n=1 Tax=Clostridium chromiireducens TaxID=225345 RepID=UPI0019240280|nr:GDP-mannose 4,6-dehydratase [Clostridium chromiireducens]